MHSAGVGLSSMDHCLQDASSIIGHAHGRSIIGSGNDGTTIASPLTPAHYHRQQQQQQQHHHQHHVHHHPGGYGTADSWVDMNAYDHNPMSDYGSYGYIPPVAHSLPSPDSMSGRMAPPPPLQTMQPHHQLHHHQQHQQQQQQHQQQQHHHQQQQQQHHQQQHHQPHHQLPMLIMPSHTTWPSMLTNPQSYSAPPISSLPLTAVGKTRLPGMGPSQPRRTLTDDDRRRMCQYHEDNPTVKQTEIGAMFGVERSTVSKVLRNKEKYLFPDDRSNSPIRRTKGKFPDIERALASWARKAQLSGADLSDAEIWEKARHFARGVGGNTDSHVKTLSSSWLEKFKLKNGLGSSGGGRLLRRASEANIIGSSRLSGLSPSLTPASPTSGPSPLSGSRSDEDIKDGMPFMGFDHNSFKHSASQPVSASGAGAGAYCQPPDTAVSYGGETMSPGAAFTFSSPDSSSNAFLANDPSRNMPPGVFQRPRSQTFPTLDLEYLNQSGGGGGDGGPATGKYPSGVENAIASDLDSPDQDAAPPQPSSSFPIDTALSSPTPLLHHSRSSGNLGGRTAAGANSSAAPLITASLIPASLSSGPSPTSPTQEDARRAATTLLNFIQSLGSNGQLFDQNEYITVVRLTEKLRLHTHGSSSATSTAPSSEPHSIGGLSRIPEGENEMSAVSMTSPIKTEVTMTS